MCDLAYRVWGQRLGFAATGGRRRGRLTHPGYPDAVPTLPITGFDSGDGEPAKDGDRVEVAEPLDRSGYGRIVDRR